MGIAHRKIRVLRTLVSTHRKGRKAVPTALKTLGDRILAKRFEQGLTGRKLAGMLGVTTQQVTRWEENVQVPSEDYWHALAKALRLDAGLIKFKFNT